MRIVDIRTHIVDGSWVNWVFVEIVTDEGLTGYGEATLNVKELAVKGALEDVKRHLVGQDPANIQRLWYQLALYTNYWRSGPVTNSALSGIDQALWDLLGKRFGVPVYSLLGGRYRDRIKVYATGWDKGARTPDEFQEQAVAAVKQRGFRALKVYPFGASDQVPEQAVLNRAVSIVQAVREAVGPDVELAVETHARLNPVFLKRVARRLEEYDLMFIEEPAAPDQLSVLADITRSIAIPTAAGERIYSKERFWELLAGGGVGIIQPDIIRLGGITEMQKTAALAEACGVLVAPHNASGPIGMAATMQVAAAIPNLLILEYPVHTPKWWGDLTTWQPAMENGQLIVPDGSGLSADLVTEAVARHPYQAPTFTVYQRKQ